MIQEVNVIGIDPGSRATGWGVVREIAGNLQLVDCGVIRPFSEKEEDFSSRLGRIYAALKVILDRHIIQAAAIEQVFTARNAMSALKLGQARGVAVAACVASGLKVYDYEPTVVKKSLVGVGRAEKEQVAFMTRRLLNIRQQGFALDTTDALAVAICHLSQRRFVALNDKLEKKLANT